MSNENNCNQHHNPVGWFEVPVKNLSRASQFYEKVLDVKLTLEEMGPSKMAMFPHTMTGHGAGGSLVQGDGYIPSHEGANIYFSVNDIPKTLDRIASSGGKILLPKTSIGQYGFIATFEDCEGNRVSLHSVT